MKRKLAAAICAAVLLCSCAKAEENAVASLTAVTSLTSETALFTETASISVTESDKTDTSAEKSETDTSPAVGSEETESETETSLETDISSEAAETSAPETEQSSEVITETEYSELLSTSEVTEAPTVTVSSSSATSAQTESPKAEVVVPKIKTGSFTGAKTVSNDIACADITSADMGVIKVTYSGECGKVKVRITKGEAVYDYDLDPAGTVFPLQSGSGTYNIKVLENVSGKTYAVALDEDFSADIKSEFAPYLVPSQYINYSQSDDCVYKAAELCAGKNGTVEKAAAMFGYITSNVKYDKELAASVKSGYVPNPDKTLESGKGICFDYASLFASMCRSQNIPTKLVMGYVRGNVYHSWNEIYTEESGWVTVDIFLKGSGWELLDPTFYASASDKSAVAEYIGDGSDYSAIYYY
ncbi:MAG: transglutaminase-like domain-containing protein [Oscillospiraceae bacterium]|nr:transglutaminase-like domain-containing protein [Oscillospiraceae bacterium]